MIPRKLLSCSPLDVDRLVKHFLNDITGEDRRLRFGYEVKDEVIDTYLAKSLENYGIKSMWFVIEEGDRFIASCHVAYDKKSKTAELGLTVSPFYRNQKIGQELFNRGVIWARAMGADSIFMHCLTENKAIQHIASKGGMTVVTIDYGEKEATIKVNKNFMAAGAEDAVMDNIAIYDTIVRNQRWFYKKFMKGLLGH